MTEHVGVGHGDEGRVHNQLRVPFHPIVDERAPQSLGPAPSHMAAAEYLNQTGSG